MGLPPLTGETHNKMGGCESGRNGGIQQVAHIYFVTS